MPTMTPTEALAVMTEEYTAERFEGNASDADAFNRARAVIAAALEARFLIPLTPATEVPKCPEQEAK